MIATYKDDKGNIQAVAEWWLVNIDGTFNDKGDYVWISELENNKDYRHKGLIKYFIKKICDATPNAKYGYFWRKKKYPNKRQKMYSRKSWLKIAEA